MGDDHASDNAVDPAFDAVRDAARQVLAASRALIEAMEQVVDDDERMAKVSDAVARGLAAAGIDLDRFRHHDPDGHRDGDEGRSDPPEKVRRIPLE